MLSTSSMLFNYNKFNFWPVYESIRKYYPLGIPKDETKIYINYQGIKDLDNLLDHHLHNAENYKRLWTKFELEVAKQTGKPVVGTTFGQAPCFSAFIKLEEHHITDMIRYKELYFFVSLLGAFYSVVEVDRSEFRTSEKKVCTTNYNVVSPKGEHTDLFSLTCKLVEAKFKGYRFVPYFIYFQKIKGLEVRYTVQEPTIFNALFNTHIDFAAATLGDIYFKSDDWKMSDYKEEEGGGWVVYPPEGYN